MYGIIIEGVRYMIEDHYGSATLALVLERAHVANLTFSTHDRYSEKIIPNLLVALADITGHSVEEVGILAGRYFVRFMMKYGHAELLKVLGRRFSDFLKGLDSLHEYFRFSYPRIRPPSFYCDRETTDGLTLHYRSRRQGYISYVMGQLIEIAKVFFDQDITVELARKEEKKGFQYVLLRVTFDNKDYDTDQLLRDKNTALNEFLPVDSLSVLNMFPYFIAFNKRMEIVVVGKALSHIIPELIGKRIDEEFDLLRPCVKFTWDACQHHLNNLFELETMYPVHKKLSNASIALAVNDQVEEKVKVPDSIDQGKGVGQIAVANGHASALKEEDEEERDRVQMGGSYLHLKGPMVYLKHSDINIYLPTVLIESLDDLFDLGLYLNDYSACDCNREIIMASVQKSDDLKELLKREKEKSRTLAKNMKDIDQARKTAKELLSQMMPKEIANELLQTGKRSVTLCEAFDEVTIAFAKVVDFNLITADMNPMSVVSLLNTTFSLFDDVVSKHGVYKVETVGESYMISCGVPYPTQNHAEYVGDTALDMIRAVESISTTVVEGKSIAVKLGLGSVSMLQSRQMNKPMTIQISVKTKVLLENFAPGQFQFENRGKINLKGKGEMLAFGLLSKKGVSRSEKYPLITAIGGHDSDNESGVYTPMDDFDDNSRASTMSRMSISMAGSRSRGTRSSGTSSSAMGGTDPNEEAEADKEGQAAKRKKEAEDSGMASDTFGDERRKAKELSKERRRKEKLDRIKERKQKNPAENQVGHNRDSEEEHPAPTTKKKSLPHTTALTIGGNTLVRGTETLGASTSNMSFLSVHNPPAMAYEKPHNSEEVNGTDDAAEEPHTVKKTAVTNPKSEHSKDTTTESARVNGVVEQAESPKENGRADSSTSETPGEDRRVKKRNTPVNASFKPRGSPPPSRSVSTNRKSLEPALEDSTTTGSISQIMAPNARKPNRVTADRIKEEARSIVANQMKAMEDIMKPVALGKTTPLPPISQLSMEEELQRLNKMKKSPMTAGNDAGAGATDNGYVVAVIDENLPAECICGRYKEAQVMKTKACRLM